MKKINKNQIVRPRNLISGWAAYDNAINKLKISACWPNNHSKIYRSDIVKDELNKYYNSHCAFCNQIPKGSPLQVEHFRPKDGIKNERHTGYYWLGYEWTNLLFSCGNCNTKKSNHFPLEPGGIRVLGPTIISNRISLIHNLFNSRDLKNEKQILLNPEIDNPDDHLIYLPSGKLHHLTSRGEYSIKKYDLNRDELFLLGRKKILDDIIVKFTKRLDRYCKGDSIFKQTAIEIIDIIEEEIIGPIRNKDSFDHFRLVIFKNYKEYILNRFTISKQILLLNYVFNSLNNGLNL